VEGFLGGARPGDAVCLILDVDLKGTSEIKFRAPIDPFRNFAPGHIHDRIRAKPLTRPALEAGCVAYLRKPFPSSLLIGAIEQIVGHNMAARQNGFLVHYGWPIQGEALTGNWNPSLVVRERT
jgi:FixJ family two-component response regulator